MKGEEPCISKYKPTSWQHFKENRPSLCEKWRNIIQNEKGKEHSTYNKKKEG